jgi:hypothetical protein
MIIFYHLVFRIINEKEKKHDHITTFIISCDARQWASCRSNFDWIKIYIKRILAPQCAFKPFYNASWLVDANLVLLLGSAEWVFEEPYMWSVFFYYLPIAYHTYHIQKIFFSKVIITIKLFSNENKERLRHFPKIWTTPSHVLIWRDRWQLKNRQKNISIAEDVCT